MASILVRTASPGIATSRIWIIAVNGPETAVVQQAVAMTSRFAERAGLLAKTEVLLESADVPRMRELMRKYRDLPMDLADAALVRVAEREKASRIFTIDRRDFELYRPRGIRQFTILP